MEYPTIEAIDQELTKLIPESKRRKCTHRVCEDLGMNALLDIRNELLERIRQFEEVFNP